MTIKVINTDDGSSNIYNEALDECYHSKFGAIAESQHVFIKNGLELLNQNQITIFEVGFGTGLNALLSAIYAQNHQKKIHYISLEKFPIEEKIVKELNYSQKLGFQKVFESIHKVEWGTNVEISPFFSLYKLSKDLIFIDYTQIESPDIIFFDAFSPGKQPELWQTGVFEKLFKFLKINGLLVTYSASGLVKTALRTAGFQIKRLPGPPGKHHMIMAKKII